MTHQPPWQPKRLLDPEPPQVPRSFQDDCREWTKDDSGDYLAELAAASFRCEDGTADPALDLVLNEIVQQACQSTLATGAAIALVRGDELICHAIAGARVPDLGVRFNTRTGLSGACLQTRKAQFCKDTENDPRVDADTFRLLEVRALAVLPIIAGQNFLGLLEIFLPRPYVFSQGEIQTLEGLCGKVAENIHHAPHTTVPSLSDSSDESWSLGSGGADDRSTLLETNESFSGAVADTATSPQTPFPVPQAQNEGLAPLRSDLSSELESSSELQANPEADERARIPQVGSEEVELPSDLQVGSGSRLAAQDQGKSALDSLPETQAGANMDWSSPVGDSKNDSDSRTIKSDWLLRAEAAFKRYAAVPRPQEDSAGENNSWDLAAEQDGKSDLEKEQANAGKNGGRDLEPKSREPESGPENSSDTVADGPLRILPAASSPTLFPQLLSTKNVSLTLKERWTDYKSTVYLAASALILLLAILSRGAPTSTNSSLQPELPFGERLLVFLGFTEPPSRVIYGNPNIRVWVDVPNAVYYCPSTDQYGKTGRGMFLRQRDAQLRRFEPAERRACS
jgi:putative methionine-R-sulfoxide reductase with GAF domain